MKTIIIVLVVFIAAFLIAAIVGFVLAITAVNAIMKLFWE